MSFFAASSPSPELLPPPLLVNCTFKWKIFGSQQKHCIQKRQSRSYSNTEEIVPGKLPFGRNRRVFFFFSFSRRGFEELHRTAVPGAGAEGRWQPLFAEERFQRKCTSKGEGKVIQCGFCTQIKTKRPPPHYQTKTARRNKARGGGGNNLCFHQVKKFALLPLVEHGPSRDFSPLEICFKLNGVTSIKIFMKQ